MRNAILYAAGSIAMGILFTASAASAGDYFILNAAGGNGAHVSVGGSSILNLVNNLINTKSQFTPLLGQGFNATLGYGGVQNALIFSQNQSQTSVTLSIPGTGFTQTFNGASPSDVQDQIRDFIKKNFLGEYAAFDKSINMTSPVAAVDGNPKAFTEYLATDAFSRFGINPTMNESPMDGASGHGELRVDAGAGFSRAGGLDGYDAELSLGSGFRLNDLIGIGFGTALQYRAVAGSETWFVGQEIGLPLSIIHPPQQDNGFGWQVTPWAFAGVVASTDQANGAVLVGGGGTSSLSYQFESLTFTLADQISYASGLPVNIDGFHLDTDVNQWILKNGVKVAWAPANGPFYVEGAISYSNLLRNGAVPDYWTPEFGFGFKFGKFSGIKLDYVGNFGKKYSESGGMLTVYFAL